MNTRTIRCTLLMLGLAVSLALSLEPGYGQQQPDGATVRGPSCRIHIDNLTPWYVDICTDGDYLGQVSPWGDSYGSVGCGDTNGTESLHFAMARISHSGRSTA
jgi:hypothetical protein